MSELISTEIEWHEIAVHVEPESLESLPRSIAELRVTNPFDSPELERMLRDQLLHNNSTCYISWISTPRPTRLNTVPCER
ncbi:hypothetical protein DTO280E4_733 [Paecilomyces variotii]|nr:hypothetical protein DTO169E5_2060 [Paecilomyces variotii]KAJ9365078.1 hypothetical protein DTO280E4_733 [Paecilomyces variotii]KAJ9369041.1 hypothetical protein DTO282E5_6250 [Paecilomyces variotii]KAJ9385992.1 hypothetical protein DTO063F5_3956 [Paecilomyces variotii]